MKMQEFFEGRTGEWRDKCLGHGLRYGLANFKRIETPRTIYEANDKLMVN